MEVKQHLNNQWVKEKKTKGKLKNVSIKIEKKTTYKNLQDAAKAILRGNLILM